MESRNRLDLVLSINYYSATKVEPNIKHVGSVGSLIFLFTVSLIYIALDRCTFQTKITKMNPNKFELIRIKKIFISGVYGFCHFFFYICHLTISKNINLHIMLDLFCSIFFRI